MMNAKPFWDQLQQSSLPVVVEAWAPWCGPCRSMQPSLERLTQQYTGRVAVWKINVDERPDVVEALRLYGVPTVVVFQRGREITRQTGAQSPPALAALFEAALGNAAVSHGPTRLDRILRIGAGLGLLALASYTTVAPLIMAAAGLVLFSAIHDRCPLWQAVRPRLKARFGSTRPSAGKADPS